MTSAAERAAAVLAEHSSERLTRRDDGGWVSSCSGCGHIYGSYPAACPTIEDAGTIPQRHRDHVAEALAAAGLLAAPVSDDGGLRAAEGGPDV